MRQFWTWVEFDHLYPFMQERDDWRMGIIASTDHNCNITDIKDARTATDYAYPTMEEIIQKEMDQRQEQEREMCESGETDTGELSEKQQREADIAAWNQRVANLIAGRKPVQTTFNG